MSTTKHTPDIREYLESIAELAHAEAISQEPDYEGVLDLIEGDIDHIRILLRKRQA